MLSQANWINIVSGYLLNMKGLVLLLGWKMLQYLVRKACFFIIGWCLLKFVTWFLFGLFTIIANTQLTVVVVTKQKQKQKHKQTMRSMFCWVCWVVFDYTVAQGHFDSFVKMPLCYCVTRITQTKPQNNQSHRSLLFLFLLRCGTKKRVKITVCIPATAAAAATAAYCCYCCCLLLLLPLSRE